MEQNSCGLCGSSSFKIIKETLRNNMKGFRVCCCESCGHIQLLPRPSIDRTKQFYDQNSQDRAIYQAIDLERLAANQQYDIKRRAEFISRLVPVGRRILDIGSGYGFFLREMLQRGYAMEGIEISRERRELAATVVDCPMRDINFSVESGQGMAAEFDAVTLFHVLEHTIDPVSFIRNVSRVVKENGILVVEVPNATELMLETSAAYNNFYWIEAHLHYFTERTLSDVLKQAGFRKIDITFVQRYGVENLCNWLNDGTPQLAKPQFKISDSRYSWLEGYYREYLQKTGRSDTLFAVAQKQPTS